MAAAMIHVKNSNGCVNDGSNAFGSSIEMIFSKTWLRWILLSLASANKANWHVHVAIFIWKLK